MSHGFLARELDGPRSCFGLEAQCLQQALMQKVLSGDKSDKAEHGQASIQSFSFDQSLKPDLLCCKIIPIAFLARRGAVVMGVSERDLIGLLPPSSARKRGHPYSAVRFQVLFRWGSLEHGELQVCCRSCWWLGCSSGIRS